MSDEKYTLKAEYSPAFIDDLATAFKKEWSDFDKNSFKKKVINKQWENRELKDRMRHVSLMLGETLPADYKKAVKILVKVAPHFTGLTATVFPDFVQVFGLQHFKESVHAIKIVTEYSTSEFAVRPYIEKYKDKMMQVMRDWSKDKNEHVRRLASEGCRPRLPWAPALKDFKQDPKPILPILEQLRNDNALYVRKSVANNLNDISKDHPDLVLSIAEKWLKEEHHHTNWIVKHALRGLLKSGNKKALGLFGFGDTKLVTLSNLSLDKKKIKIGDTQEFSFDINWKGKKPIKLRLEFGVDYMKSNGKTNRKIFQIKEAECSPNKTYSIVKRHSFEQRSTRKHYPGKHNIAIIVNGDELAIQSFEVTQ